MEEFSKLRPFIADSKEDGPNSVLYIKGFSSAEEIQRFTDALYNAGILKPPPVNN